MPAGDGTDRALRRRFVSAARRHDHTDADRVLDQWLFYRDHATEWDADCWGIRGLGQDDRMKMEQRIALARNNAEVI
jgi:hypothetical protein